MNDSDSGSEFEDDTKLDDSYSGNDTDVHSRQGQRQGGTKNVQPGTARPMDIDNHDTDSEDGGGTF
jgi:hypothetical protein